MPPGCGNTRRSSSCRSWTSTTPRPATAVKTPNRRTTIAIGRRSRIGTKCAAQRLVGDLIKQGRMDVFVDLHNPAPGDPTFFYILPDELLKQPMIGLRNRFIELAYGRISKIKPLIPMSNKPKVTGAGYHPLWRQISANWVALHGNEHTVSVCLETVWNYENSTTEGYRAVAHTPPARCAYLGERPAKGAE